MGEKDAFEELGEVLNTDPSDLHKGEWKNTRAWITIADACRTGSEVTVDDLAIETKMRKLECRRTLSLAVEEGLLEQVDDKTFRPV